MTSKITIYPFWNVSIPNSIELVNLKQKKLVSLIYFQTIKSASPNLRKTCRQTIIIPTRSCMNTYHDIALELRGKGVSSLISSLIPKEEMLHSARITISHLNLIAYKPLVRSKCSWRIRFLPIKRGCIATFPEQNQKDNFSTVNSWTQKVKTALYLKLCVLYFIEKGEKITCFFRMIM